MTHTIKLINIMKKFLTTIMLLLTGIASSQTTDDWCGAHELLEKKLHTNIELLMNIEELNSSTLSPEFGKITIPVVVHIVYKDSSEIPSEDVIKSQIQSLTDDFNAENWDVGKTPEGFEKSVADFNISFKFAKLDPDGNKTNGITYTKTNEEYFFMDFDEVKYNADNGKDAWDTERYLNIWVCDLEPGLRGYSQFPGDYKPTDGVVVDYTDIGIKETVNTDGKDRLVHYRVLTHEVGHWFGLFHMWGDRRCGDDMVKDTPSQEMPHILCYEKFESCNSNDLTVNYMDYVESQCMVMFTKGQKRRAMVAIKKFRGNIVRNGKKLTRQWR